jgi:hypothetical protein
VLMSIIKVSETASNANLGEPLARLVDNVIGLPLLPQAAACNNLAVDP